MDIRKIVIGAALLFGATSANATELLCKGRGWIVVGDGFPDTVVMKLDPTTLEAVLIMTRGTASGTLIPDPKLYTGTLSLANGKKVWINLDRYTGELWVVNEPMSDPTIFSGSCEEARRKF